MTPYWQSKCGRWVIYCGDCLEILPQIPAGTVDAVVTDPPFGTGGMGGGYGRSHIKIANDDDTSFLRASWPHVLNAIGTGWAAVFYGARRTPEVCEALAGAEWFGEIVWDKAQPGLGYHIRYAHESVAVIRVGSPPVPPSALLSVLRAAPVRGGDHPHQKPASVLEALVAWASPIDGLILDPFLGSGTTLVACVKTGRRGIGIELEERYCEIAARRIEAESSHLFAESI